MSRYADRARAAAFALLLLASGACAPRLKPLEGAPAPARRLPPTGLPGAPTKVIFDWELDDQDFSARGEGVARLQAPDSARLDFFLAGGMGSGAAVLVGNELRTPPGPDFARRLVPPPPLLWAAFGRLALPPEADTVARVDGDRLRADIGRPVRWRATFRGDSLERLERVDGDRVVEWVERAADGRVRYRHESARRSLSLTPTRRESSERFDASIWRF